MDIKQAEQIGRDAFAAGRGNFPLADARVAAECEDAKVGEKTHLMRAFSQGWHAANIAAAFDAIA